MIEPVIVLKSVGADDIVVVRIFQPENQSTGSINTSGDGFELHAQVQVFERSFIRNQQWKAIIGFIIGSLGDHIGLGGSS